MAETYTDYFPTQLLQDTDCVICKVEINFLHKLHARWSSNS